MEVNVTSWEIDDFLTTGKRVKRWLIDPSRERWLFKEPEVEGERIAEFLAYKLGTELFDLEIPETKLADFNGTKGIIVKSFLSEGEEKYSLEEAIDFFGPEFDADDLSMYQLETALSICEKYNCVSEFIQMSIFDYVIANQDRHCENWGFLTSVNTRDKKFSPIYDNGSSLMCGYDEQQIKSMLSDNRRFEAYNRKSRSIFTVHGNKKCKNEIFMKELIKYDLIKFKECFTRFERHTYDTLKMEISSYLHGVATDNRVDILSKMISLRISTLKIWILEGEELC